jgi:hypothetical protein
VRLYLDGLTNSRHTIDLRIDQLPREKIMLGVSPRLTDCGLSDFCSGTDRRFRRSSAYYATHRHSSGG